MSLSHYLRFSSYSCITVFLASLPAQGASLPSVIEEVTVTGGRDAIATLSGSAQLLDEEALEQFDFADLNQVLATLPGVYIRYEDGFGLRPNIGLRGVTSERSQKITLMEDGVLIKPAPYSAPAAYYIPNIARMHAVEVVKGPAAIKSGPNNVGGAINLVTQPIPELRTGFFDLSLGSDGYRKGQFFFGDRSGDLGFWIDALHFGSDGFKNLDGGGDTGFTRNDFNAKLQWEPSDLGGYSQRFTLKVGYADEDSDETYLGLTAGDFDVDPSRRYAASQLDRFDSKHVQFHLSHALYASDDLTVNTQLYWNRFERAWNKLDGFVAGVPLRSVLTQPTLFPSQLAILRGESDSNGAPSETLDVTNNDREYYSRGIQTSVDYRFNTGNLSHLLEAGLRYHEDGIERDHFTRSYLMSDGSLVGDGIVRGNKVLNQADSTAWATFLNNTVEWGDWTVNAGIRYEHIDGDFDNQLDGRSSGGSTSFLAPGVGVFWQFTDELGFLMGINKGFSPAGASAGGDVDPEEATNYEYGLRYVNETAHAEVIGFFSDYDNLIGRCRASDAGCNVGEEFNGGTVEIAGVEVLGEWLLNAGAALEFPITMSYTYTESAFQTSFESNFSQWGSVRQGDELPYLPAHVARLQLGVRSVAWEAFVAYSYQDEMRDEAGRGDSQAQIKTDSYALIDFSASWRPNPTWLLQLSVDNVLDEEAIVSWRPFGARPNKPRTLRMRAKYQF